MANLAIFVVLLAFSTTISSDAFSFTRNRYSDKKRTVPLISLRPARKVGSIKWTKHPFDFPLGPGPVVLRQSTVIPQTLGTPIKPIGPARPIGLGMEWENCGSSSDPVKLDFYFSNPLELPGNISVSLNATLDMDLTSPLTLKITLEKEVGDQYIEIPCIDNIGSCTYDDVCELLSSAFPPDKGCPKPFVTHKLPCNCPFKKGVYILPTSSFTVSKVPSVSPSLINGHYKITAKLSTNGRQLACYTTPRYIDVEIKSVP